MNFALLFDFRDARYRILSLAALIILGLHAPYAHSETKDGIVYRLSYEATENEKCGIAELLLSEYNGQLDEYDRMVIDMETSKLACEFFITMAESAAENIEFAEISFEDLLSDLRFLKGKGFLVTGDVFCDSKSGACFIRALGASGLGTSRYDFVKLVIDKYLPFEQQRDLINSCSNKICNTYLKASVGDILGVVDDVREPELYVLQYAYIGYVGD